MLAGTAVLGLALSACGSDSGSDATDKNSVQQGILLGVGQRHASDTLHQRQVQVRPDERGRVQGRRHPAAHGQPGLPGPPEVAGVGLAVSDINAAGGVDGAKACHDVQDSGDSTDMSVSTSSAGTLVAGKPSLVVGAASSSVSLNVVDTFADNKIVEVSPANTAVDLSGYSPYYFRTAPPDGIQGNALGTLISTDGYKKVAFLVFNDTYGTGLRNAVQATIEAAGGEVVYGGKGDGDEFPAGQTTFSSEVGGALAAKPDAIVVLAFDETKQIVPELASQGWDMSKTYFSDGNTADYSKVFEAGTLEGAQGTIPGADPDATFKGRVSGWAEVGEGKALTDYAYAAESYDATILGALAAVKGGATDSATIQKNYAAVSGATDGEECSTYEDCVKLLDAGKEIRYKGPSGIGPINDKNDPSSAFIGIYTFNGQNKNELTNSVEGSS